MKKILKKYGNTAIIGLNKEDMQTHNLKVGDNVNIEINKGRTFRNVIIRDVFTQKVTTPSYSAGVIDYEEMFRAYFQSTRKGYEFCMEFKNDVNLPFLIDNLKAILEELEFKEELQNRVNDITKETTPTKSKRKKRYGRSKKTKSISKNR